MSWNREFAPDLGMAAYEYFNGTVGIQFDEDGTVKKVDADGVSHELTADELQGAETKLVELIAEYEAQVYIHARKAAYPDLGEQLDMLYHDIKNGTLDAGEWITAIEAVKAANPKP